jgi:hypothetical protein
MFRRLTTLALLLIITFTFTHLVTAQAAPILETLHIAFWPEYDRPSTLVIYRGQLTADTPLPAGLTFRIPAAYGPPLAVAFSDGTGLFNLDYTTSFDGDDMLIAFTTPAPNFQFEYYDTSLALTTSTRQYSFAASAPYAIKSLTLELQQPIGASNILTTPALTGLTAGDDTLLYQNGVFENLSDGDPITLNVTYTKTTDTLSANATGPVSTPQLPAPDSPTATGSDWWLPWVAGVLVLLAVGGAGWYMLKMRSSGKPAGRARRRQVKPQAKASKPAMPESLIFCHSCGHRATGNDRFCRNCGTELRRPG